MPSQCTSFGAAARQSVAAAARHTVRAAASGERSPSQELAQTAALDVLIDALLRAQSAQELAKVVGENIIS